MQQEHEDEELGILVVGYRLYSSVSMSHSVQSITASWCRVKCIVRSVYSAPYPFRILKPHINKKSRACILAETQTSLIKDLLHLPRLVDNLVRQ